MTINQYTISRYPVQIARYRMFKHEHEQSNAINPCRYKLLYATKKRWRQDGLNNLKYNVTEITFDKLYTNITVDLFEKESKKVLAKEICCDCIQKKN